MPALRAVCLSALSAALLARDVAGEIRVLKPPAWLPAVPSPDADALPPGAFARLGSTHFKDSDPITAVVVPGDGRTIVSASPGRLVVWDGATGRQRCRYCSSQYGGVCLAAGGDTVAVVNGGPEVRLIDAATGGYTPLASSPAERFARVAVSPDGSVVAAFGRRIGPEPFRANACRSRIVLWDARTGRKLVEMALADRTCTAMALSRCGKHLAERGDDGRLHLWDAEAGYEVGSFPLPQSRNAEPFLAFAPGGDAVAFPGPDGETVVAAATGKTRFRLKPADRRAGGTGVPRCAGAAFSPDGSVLAVAGLGGIRLFDTGRGRERGRFDEPGNSTRAVAFAADGRTLVTGGDVGRVRVWDVASGRERLAPAGHTAPVTGLAFSPDGRLLASADGALRLWDVARAREVRRFPREPGAERVAFAPDGHRLATTSGSAVTLWDVSSGRAVRSSDGEGYSIMGLAFTPDGRALVCADEGGVVWRSPATLAAGKRLPGRPGSARTGLATPAGGKTLVAVPGARGQALVADESGAERAVTEPLSNEAICSLALSPDGRHLVAGTERECVLWDLAQRREVCRWAVPHFFPEIATTVFSGDGRLLAVSQLGRGTRVFEVASGGEVMCLERVYFEPWPLAFATDGRTLAAAESAGTILLWDLTGTRGRDLIPPSAAAVAALWEDLRGEDAARAYRAVWRLAESPAQAVPFLRERLRPAEPVAAGRVRALVADLDDRRFAPRRAAFRGLSEVAESAEPELRQAARGSHTPEAGEALDKLLRALDAERLRPTGERLRAARAVQALEYTRTPESRALLERLAAGAPGATLTREARAAVERLGR